MMRKGLPAITFLLAALLVSGDVLANLTAARATPRQVQLTGSSDTTVSISWRVSTTSDHLSGVTSPDATLVDPATGAVLMTINTTFDAGGAGPFAFRETIPVSADMVRTLVERGTQQIIVRRVFTEAAGSTVVGSVVLRLSGSRLQATRDAAPGALSVTSLRLQFGTGNDTAIADIDEALRAALTVTYTGTGVLSGRWQVAGPESPDAAPRFRTLAVLNKNLATNQRSILQSPALPTGRSGRYLLRFCVTNQEASAATGDAQCPNPELVTLASYHVRASAAGSVAPISGLSPNRQRVSASSIFSWGSLEGAHIYQLQVFAVAPATAEPRFVTGMLLDAATTETAMSDLVRSKLQDGQRYLWRVTAHDETGRMIGRSSEASFVYVPAE